MSKSNWTPMRKAMGFAGARTSGVSVVKRTGGSQPEGSPFTAHEFGGKVEFFGRTPKVLVTRPAYQKMRWYVAIAEKEVGWLGTVSRTASGDFLIEDVFLFKQEVSYTETEISEEGLSEFATELLAEGQSGMDKWNKIRFWGHSHVRMDTSPSGTDESTMGTFRGSGHPWFVRGIFNKLGRAEFTIYLYDSGVRIRDAEWEIYEPVDGSLRESIQAEFDLKVTEKVFSQTVVVGGGARVSDNYLRPRGIVRPAKSGGAFLTLEEVDELIASRRGDRYDPSTGGVLPSAEEEGENQE